MELRKVHSIVMKMCFTICINLTCLETIKSRQHTTLLRRRQVCPSSSVQVSKDPLSLMMYSTPIALKISAYLESQAVSSP